MSRFRDAHLRECAATHAVATGFCGRGAFGTKDPGLGLPRPLEGADAGLTHGENSQTFVDFVCFFGVQGEFSLGLRIGEVVADDAGLCSISFSQEAAITLLERPLWCLF